MCKKYQELKSRVVSRKFMDKCCQMCKGNFIGMIVNKSHIINRKVSKKNKKVNKMAKINRNEAIVSK